MTAKRAASSRTKTTRPRPSDPLKDAILEAATETGSDGEGTGGLSGYCRFLAREEPKAFLQLLNKVLPIQVSGDEDAPVGVQVTFVDANKD